jgi:DNA-binding XRE family transcriptional regulator
MRGKLQGVSVGGIFTPLRCEASADEFARKADIPYTTLTKIETGVIKKPSVFVIAKLAKTLGVSIEDLIR